MPEGKKNIDLWRYDFETDTFFFRDKNLQYHTSIDMGNLILDLGEDGTPIGIELLDASKNFNVSKIVMKGIEGFNATIDVSETEIKVTIKAFVKLRNTKVEKVSVSYGVNDVNLQTGQTAMVS
ncbi:DUF2283 domain-containing protein [Methanosarcina horonobensis]|uniref:DUF2283 domain-containing protein n=1 Tax=Methanosarcina horonobensis TaxID=418008 RepID=UPI00064F6AF7|nr:DUF2283 domain-containing protein [Methanosarcina horonobensis]